VRKSVSRARRAAIFAALGFAIGVAGMSQPQPLRAAATTPSTAPSKPPLSADEFVAALNTRLADLTIEHERALWVADTYITPDTEFLAAKANERLLAYVSRAASDASAYQGTAMSRDTARALLLLKQSLDAPAPKDPAKRAEFARLSAKLSAEYGSGRYCEPAAVEKCQNIDDLSALLATSRNFDELTEAWRRWHTISAPMRGDYAKFVELANEGAREFGYRDLGALWRSSYDMDPDEFAAESARLWREVEPLYQDLHCYARARLARKYGADRVPPGKPIPAQLLGNLWAQQWNNVYDLLEPYPGASDLDTDGALAAQKYDAVRMAKNAEQFYVSLGFAPLPATFWERSMLTRPRDREVVCHAYSDTLDFKDDIRIKMCIQPTLEDLKTIYHEMGHDYYFWLYKDQPFLFQTGAHDGFHEAIGDTVTLSMTPAYLESVGLVKHASASHEAMINQQMKQALEKIAFLPFGKLIDEWRWRVFSGEIPPANYNAAWWELRRKYQGVSAPLARSEADFDPGAKYHVANDTPYTRYFLSFIIQFQFQKALCQAAGFTGPLHECSIYGNKEAGRRFMAMLAAGASRPWQDTFEKLTGTRRMDAAAINEYFAPLAAWLREQNKAQTCGWSSGSAGAPPIHP
jgi:peptidyl-dipeptidase A